jgi:hypothetical protein
MSDDKRILLISEGDVEMYGLEPKQGGLWFLDLENQIENKKREGATGLDKMVERGDIVLFVFDFKPSAEDLACLPECEWVYPPENLWSKPK